jgi:hypothetical protein
MARLARQTAERENAVQAETIARLRSALTYIAQGGNTYSDGETYVQHLEKHARAALSKGAA